MLLCPWDSPGKNTGVRCHVSCIGRKVLYHQHHLGSPFLYQVVRQMKLCHWRTMGRRYKRSLPSWLVCVPVAPAPKQRRHSSPGSCRTCCVSNAWFLLLHGGSNTRYPKVSLSIITAPSLRHFFCRVPPARHLTMACSSSSLFSENSRGQIFSKFHQHGTKTTSLPFGEAQLCSLQQGLPLNLGGPLLLRGLHLSPQSTAPDYCYSYTLQSSLYFLLANPLLLQSPLIVNNSFYYTFSIQRTVCSLYKSFCIRLDLDEYRA